MRNSTDVVVLCLDGSDESLHAAKIALSLVRPDHFRFVLASVVPDLDATYTTGLDPMVPMTPDPELLEVVKLRRQQTEEFLAQAAAALDMPGSERLVLAGPAGPALAEFARQENPALLVAGARGFNDTRESGVGAVPDHLVRKAPCPVLVVRGDARVNASGPVFICVDGSEHARHAALSVTPLLPATVPVTLATVAAKSPATAPDETGYEILSDRRWEAEEDAVLSDTATAIERPDANHTVLTGPPAETLVAAAAQSGAQAMVLGSKGHGAIARAVLGSVAHTILTTAPFPVFVAGPRS